MFAGHFAIGYAARRAAPRVSLATLFAAATLLDLVWPLLLLFGVEQAEIDTSAANPFLRLHFLSYPWSHSLIAAAIWAILFALVYFALRRDGLAATVLAAVVFSHWILDWITHRPDLQLLPSDETRAGLGLWRTPAATIAVESVMFAAGVMIYMQTTRARDRIGSAASWTLVALLYAIYIASTLAPPPPSMHAVAWAGLIGGGLTCLWAWWADRHRERRVAGGSAH
jgi:hypothetical protein